VPAARRGGFLDLWQGSNALELTSHPYEGDLYDNNGEPIHFSGIYRTDFMTQLAAKFISSSSAKSPFFLTLSYLEVHHQNDIDKFVPPKEYAGRYANPFVPGDLRPLPGSWPSQLSDYYGCVAKMDETVGTIRRFLAENGLDRTRIVKAEVVVTDHANKPAFDEAWASWMPDGKGPVRSFVQSIMPEGDMIEIIVTAALP